MYRYFSRLLPMLIIALLLAACGSQPKQPDQDTLDRRDDAMDELDRNTRRY